jgi:hypothetical protein
MGKPADAARGKQEMLDLFRATFSQTVQQMDVGFSSRCLEKGEA